MEENNIETKKSNKLLIIIIIIVMILAIVGIIVALTLGGKKEENTTTTTSTSKTTSTSTSTTTTTTTTTTTAPVVKNVTIPKKISTKCKTDSNGVPIVDNNTDSILCGANKLLMGIYRDIDVYAHYPINDISELNKIDNGKKLANIYWWGKDEDKPLIEKSSDEILKAYQSIYGKDYTLNFTDIYDDYYNNHNDLDCKEALKFDEDSEDYDSSLESCWYIYDSKTKKYTLSPIYGGHGTDWYLKGYLEYIKPVSYLVNGNQHIIKYHMIFIDEEEQDGDWLLYPILDLKKGELGTHKLTIYSEGDTITDKVYEKYKSKLSEIQFTFELVDKHLILKSIQ